MANCPVCGSDEIINNDYPITLNDRLNRLIASFAVCAKCGNVYNSLRESKEIKLIRNAINFEQLKGNKTKFIKNKRRS